MRPDRTSAPRELFIYYRVALAHAAVAAAAVARFQADLTTKHPHLVARLLCRPEAADGHETWMETYSTDPMKDDSGISTALQAEIEAGAADVLRFIDGPRHIEVFVACVS